MDAGALTDLNSILQLSAGSAADQRNHVAQFFNAEANAVLGSFGASLGIWGKNSGAEPPNFALGGCHLDGQYDSSAFFPRWRWERRSSTSTATRMCSSGSKTEHRLVTSTTPG